MCRRKTIVKADRDDRFSESSEISFCCPLTDEIIICVGTSSIFQSFMKITIENCSKRFLPNNMNTLSDVILGNNRETHMKC